MFDTSIIGKTISFRLHPSQIIREEFSDVKVVAIGSFETVSVINAAELHTQVYPTLPAGTPNDYRAYNYLVVRFPGGGLTAVGFPWVIEDSIVLSDAIDIIVTIRGKSVSDIDALRRVLAANGYTNVGIRTSSINDQPSQVPPLAVGPDVK